MACASHPTLWSHPPCCGAAVVTPTVGGACPDNVLMAQCLVAPCSLPNACPANHACKNSYCGGCNAICTSTRPGTLRWERAAQRCICAVIACTAGAGLWFAISTPAHAALLVHTLPVLSGEEEPCNGTIVSCKAAPCSLPNACPADHSCQDNYCDGCNAICTPNKPPGELDSAVGSTCFHTIQYSSVHCWCGVWALMQCCLMSSPFATVTGARSDSPMQRHHRQLPGGALLAAQRLPRGPQLPRQLLRWLQRHLHTQAPW